MATNRGKRPEKTIRTAENAELICIGIEEGNTLGEIAQVLGCVQSAITNWVRDDAKLGGHEIAARYQRAQENRCDALAEELLRIADDRSFMGRPDANAIVQQQRLAIDTRKWILAKMLPRKFGDKVEIAHDPSAPLVTRIELVAVQPRRVEPPTIELDLTEERHE